MAVIIKIIRTETEWCAQRLAIPSKTQTFQQGNLKCTLIQTKVEGNAISPYKSSTVINIDCIF